MQNDDFMMTEEDWLRLPSPLEFVRKSQRADRTKLGRRQLRLFACGCCRKFWSQLSAESREAIEIAERYADGQATKKEMGYAWRTTVHEWGEHERTADHVAGHVVEAGAMTAAVLTAMLSYTVWARSKPTPVLWRETARQASMIRDIFGNPFQNIKLDPAWITANVTDLASSIYDNRTFNRLPELAELLREAGCDIPQIMNHCRSDEPHVRGCWVIDWILGKGIGV